MTDPRFQRNFGYSPFLNPIGGSQQEPPRKPTTSEVLATLIVPALSLVATIVALQRDQRIIAWLLLGVLFLSFAVGFYSSVKSRVRESIADGRDQRLARRSFSEFRNFVRRFDEFAAAPSSRTDTLHAIVLGELCGGSSSNLEKFRIVPAELFHPFSLQLRSRVDQQQRNLRNLLHGLEELSLLTRSYTRYCVLPMFDEFPQDLRPSLTERAKSNLESFRERYVRFLDDYSEYLDSLAQSFSKPRIEPHYFPRPKPL